MYNKPTLLSIIIFILVRFFVPNIYFGVTYAKTYVNQCFRWVKTAVFQKQPFTCITSANINVIRPTGTLRGAYLKLFLDSPVGGKLLKSLQRGSTVVNLNYKDLAELEIPVPPIQVQDALIVEYNAGLTLYKQTLAAAEEAWQGVQNEILPKIY